MEDQPTPKKIDASHSSGANGKAYRPYGGGGAFQDAREMAESLNMLEVAIRQEWRVSRSKRRRIMARLYDYIRDDSAEPDTVLSAVKAIGMLDALNQRRESAAADVDREQGTTVNIGLNLATLRQELLGSERHLDHPPADGDPGEVREICEQGPLANGSTPGKTEPGNNGYHNGNGRH